MNISKLTNHIVRIGSRVAMYAVVVWYVAEITGNGMELRRLVRYGAQWGVYYARYSAWYARKELNGR